MISTLASGVLLLFVRPGGVPLWSVVAGLALFAVIAVFAATMQAPQHAKFSRGFDRRAYEFLIRTTRLRTAAWSVYALLVLWMVWVS